MKIRPYPILIFCMLIGLVLIPDRSAQAKKKLSLSADSAIVMDVQSGAILYKKNMDKKQYPASITKIMTTLVALENSSMNETVTYSKGAVTNLESGASNIGLVPGEKMSMENSLYAVMLASANEACNGVGEHIAGSVEDFVNLMNERAKEIGCTGTHFANPNGLWLENHYTTAHDMALIAREAYKNPTFAKITGTKRYQLPDTNKTKNRGTMTNHHAMLVAGNFSQFVYDYCVGGKTGYTSKCRYTLVTFAKKEDMILVSVVMRADSPWVEKNEYTDSIKLLNYGFDNFKRYSIREEATKEIAKNNLFTKFSPFYSEDTSSLSIDEGADVILPKNVGMDQVEKKIEYYSDVRKLSDGRKVIGKISYTYKDREVGGSNIYYKKLNLPTLNDSIDMSEWFEDSVEKVNKGPFPWKKVILIGIVVLIVLFVLFLFVQRVRAEREARERRNRYRRTRKSLNRNEDGVYYRRK